MIKSIHLVEHGIYSKLFLYKSQLHTSPCFHVGTGTSVNDDAATTTSVLTENSAPAVVKKSSFLIAWAVAGVFVLLTVVFSLVSITLCYMRYSDKLCVKGKTKGKPKITSK